MSRQIITFNTNNYVSNNKYVVKPSKAIKFKKGDTLSIYSFSAYNSIYNISGSKWNNNSISFKWFDGTIYNWIIPDGYYSVDQLNYWLQTQFIKNLLYCTNNSQTQYIYFAQFQTNAPLYKNEIDIFYFPSSSNASSFGWIKPSSATWNFPTQNTMVQLTICNGLMDYFGMSSRTTFGNESIVKNYQYLSDIAPEISKVSSYVFTTNIVENNYNLNPNVFAQFPINVPFGQLMQVNSVMDIRLDIKAGDYNEIVLQLWDQNFNPLEFIDKELTLFLIIDFAKDTPKI